MTFPVFGAVGVLAYVADGTANITPGLPAGHASGNELRMMVWAGAASGTVASAFTTPSGWTKLEELYNSNDFGDEPMSAACYAKTDGGSESDPTITRTGTTGVMGAIIVSITGADSTEVSSSLVYAKNSELSLPAITDHATLDTLAVLIAGREATVGVWVGAAPPRLASWVEEGNPDGTGTSAVVGSLEMSGDVTAGGVWGEQNSNKGYMKWGLSLPSSGGGSPDKTASITASLPVPVVAATAHGSNAPTEDVVVLTENNCTVTISGASTITYGQHRNDAGYGVLCDQDIYVTSTTPTPTTLGSGRARHGVEIDPTITTPNHQGFDSIRSSYSDALNYGPGIESTPLLIAPTSGSPISLIKVYSLTSPGGGDDRAAISDAMVVTFYHPDDYPADIANTYRPAYFDGDAGKFGVGLTYGMIDTARLRAHDLTALTHPLSSGDATSIINAVQKVQLTRVNDWPDDSWHPQNHMAEYSRDFAQAWSRAIRVANSTYSTDACVDAMVQLGIDLHGKMLNGGHHEPDGGEGGGRSYPIIFAGWLLGDVSMYGIDDNSYPAGALGVVFGERGNVWWGTEADNGRVTTYGTYGPSIVDLPEWGLRHSTDPTEDNPDWDASLSTPPQGGYRRCCTYKGYIGSILSIRVMGVATSDDYDPLGPSADLKLAASYMQRYLDTEVLLGQTWMPDTWEQDDWADNIADVPAANTDKTADITTTLPVPVVVMDCDVFTAPSRTADITAELPVPTVRLRAYVHNPIFGDAAGWSAFGIEFEESEEFEMAYNAGAAVTPSNTVGYDAGDGLYVGTGGNVAVVPVKGSPVTIAVPDGAVIPIRSVRVNATGTTATDIVVLYK